MTGAITRPADLLARYGGEEFVVILPNTDLEGAKVIADRLCRSVERAAIPHEYSQVSNYVTVSIGLVSQTPDAAITDFTTLTDTADQQLYRAKQSGRNRVCALE